MKTLIRFNPLEFVMGILLVLMAVIGTSCTTAYPEPVRQAVHDPNSDAVGQAAQIAAIKQGSAMIAENLSQMQDDGWAHWLKSKEIARNADDSPLMIQLPNGVMVPVYNEYESLGKWNLTNILSGAGDQLGAIDELEFTNGQCQRGMPDNAFGNLTIAGDTTVKAYANNRNGFRFWIKGTKGNVGIDPAAIKAKYEGQAAVKAAIAASLGQIVEQHWLGKQGLLKVAMDGTVSIMAQGKEIVGEFVKLTPLGAAADGLEQVAVTYKEVKSGQASSATSTTVLTEQPATE